jgi:hypothetical protein
VKVRNHTTNQGLLLFFLAALGFWGLLVVVSPASGGEPIAVGGQVGTPGEPFLWDTQTSIPYRTDGGSLGKFDNTQANNVVEDMFGVWEAVTTATIEFNSNGQLKSAGAFVSAADGGDGDVDTMAEFNAVTGNCDDERLDANMQSPIIYDADGSLFDALMVDPNVIGFAGLCAVDTLNRIRGGNAALNGKFIDLAPSPELTEDEFRQAFTHEFGHFAGLGHSQINVEVLGQFPSCNSDDVVGLPLMFPVLQCDARVTLGLDPLAPDDIAWISFLYPRQPDFDNQFGRITGEILFSDGITPVQGGNVIAREPDNLGTAQREDRRNAVSVVSGYLFTGNPGQSVTGTNPGSNIGSRDPTLIGFYEIPVLAGDYTVEVESINAGFIEGSSVGPLGIDFPSGANEQLPLPGPPEFWNLGESSSDDPTTKDTVLVIAAQAVANPVDIILNGTPSRFDSFESARLWLREPAPAWVRRRMLLDSMVVG